MHGFSYFNSYILKCKCWVRVLGLQRAISRSADLIYELSFNWVQIGFARVAQIILDIFHLVGSLFAMAICISH